MALKTQKPFFSHPPIATCDGPNYDLEKWLSYLLYKIVIVVFYAYVSS